MRSPALKSMVRTLLRRSPSIESTLRGLYLPAHFHPVSPENLTGVSERLSTSWMADGIPGQQRAVVEPQLAAYRAGKPSSAFDTLVDVLSHNISRLENKSLLEIGCSSWYYLEVLGCSGVVVA